MYNALGRVFFLLSFFIGCENRDTYYLKLSGVAQRILNSDGNKNEIEKKESFLNHYPIQGVFCHFDDCYKAKIKLRGDLKTHWSGNVKSLEVEYSYDRKYKNKISFVKPEDRYFEIELLGNEIAKMFSLPHLKTELNYLNINGKKVSYMVIDNFDKVSLDKNKYNISHIIGIKNLWIPTISSPAFSQLQYGFLSRNHSFNEIRLDLSVYDIFPNKSADVVLLRFNALLKAIKSGNYDVIHKFLDLNQMASHLAIMSVMGNIHSSLGDNLKFGFSQSSQRFIPLVQDFLLLDIISVESFLVRIKNGNGFYNFLLQDQVFKKMFIDKLKSLSEFKLDKAHERLLANHKKFFTNDVNMGPRFNPEKRKKMIRHNLKQINLFFLKKDK